MGRQMRAAQRFLNSGVLVEQVHERLQLIFVRGRKVMPPKKKSEGAEGSGPLLGRFGTSLKCGIVGLPNVG